MGANVLRINFAWDGAEEGREHFEGGKRADRKCRVEGSMVYSGGGRKGGVRR